MTELEELLKESIYNAPLTLLNYKDKDTINYINGYLPYSTGFEIECDKKPSFNLEDFTSIPDIVHVQVDSCEQRYRIPSGLKGFICLYHISKALVKNSTLNLGSGIHYHVDMTSWYTSFDKYKAIKDNSQWMLNELDSWNYKGKYNSRRISEGSHTWARFSNPKKTLEFRLGEMTFDYKVLVKRIIHANDIVRRLKNQVQLSESMRLEELNKQLRESIKEKPQTQEEIDMDEFIKRRLK